MAGGQGHERRVVQLAEDLKFLAGRGFGFPRRRPTTLAVSISPEDLEGLPINRIGSVNSPFGEPTLFHHLVSVGYHAAEAITGDGSLQVEISTSGCGQIDVCCPQLRIPGARSRAMEAMRLAKTGGSPLAELARQARELKGDLFVSSLDGGGSKFTFRFPRAEQS